MEVTLLEYEKALTVLSKVELAEKAVKAYEEQQRWVDDPVSEIMEQGKVVFIEGETIRETPLLWRATKIHYVHEKGTVERIIQYTSDPNGKELLKSDLDSSRLL